MYKILRNDFRAVQDVRLTNLKHQTEWTLQELRTRTGFQARFPLHPLANFQDMHELVRKNQKMRPPWNAPFSIHSYRARGNNSTWERWILLSLNFENCEAFCWSRSIPTGIMGIEKIEFQTIWCLFLTLVVSKCKTFWDHLCEMY